MLKSNDNFAQMPLRVRMRRSPFWESSHAHEPHGYLVYNNMLIASHFGNPEEAYHHPKRAVQLWDVGCKRQVEISGPDVARLVRMSTPHDISRMADDQCYYIPTVDRDGETTNDPVLLRLDEDRYRVSISDSDLILFYKGVAAAPRLDVLVREPVVFPLGIQGPKADDLATRLRGETVRELQFFRHMLVDVNGVPMLLTRSGFSTHGKPIEKPVLRDMHRIVAIADRMQTWVMDRCGPRKKLFCAVAV